MKIIEKQHEYAVLDQEKFLLASSVKKNYSDMAFTKRLRGLKLKSDLDKPFYLFICLCV